MTAADYTILRTSIQQHEGLRLTVYADTLGTATIGYGRNLSTKGISSVEALMLLDHDLEDAIVGCQAQWPWFADLDGIRQRVLCEMVYQLGLSGVLGFRRMLMSVEAGEYESAAEEMVRSRWAQQTPNRATALAALMRTPPTISA